MSQDQDLTFEEAYRALEAVVRRLEEGNLTLDESIAHYERGMGLARRCQATLDRAELRVQQLALGDEGPGADAGFDLEA